MYKRRAIGGKKMDEREREMSRGKSERDETGEESEETNKCSEECGEERRVKLQELPRSASVTF
jgi:hypothetical protein